MKINLLIIITTPEFNELTAENVTAKLKQANLITTKDIDDKIKSLNRKINSKKKKHTLVENELKKLKTFDSGRWKWIEKTKTFDSIHDTQNCLVFQPMYAYF